jgi:hypothetical protein
MAGRLAFSLMDHDGERGAVSLNTGAVTAVSLPGLLTEVGTLRGAIEGITLGVVAKESLTVFDTPLANTPPADENAQVERVWIVSFEDNLPFFDDPVNAIPNEGYRKRFSLTIPTADIEGRLLPNTEIADLTDTGIAAFVTAFEATARSPYGGTVNVLSIVSGGRNR